MAPIYWRLKEINGMNVMRFTGKNNRSALDQVRQHLGPDALILANRRTADGVEICATRSLPDLSAATPAPSTHTAHGHNDIQLAQLKRELASLRETLQTALGDRKWQDTAQHRPVAATIAQRLGALGLGRVLAGELADAAGPNLPLEQAWQVTQQTLAAKIQTLSDAELAGLRVKAVVGASGSGKTRAAMALLADAVARYGAEHVVAISTDESPYGNALTQFCKQQTVQHLVACDRKALSEAMSACNWAREIIVDTAGLSPGKGVADPVLTLLKAQRAGMTGLLLLPATSQHDYLRQMVEHAAILPIAAAVLSKLDEAVSLGGIVDVTAGQALPIAGAVLNEATGLAQVSAQSLLTEAKKLTRAAMQRRAAKLKVAV